MNAGNDIKQGIIDDANIKIKFLERKLEEIKKAAQEVKDELDASPENYEYHEGDSLSTLLYFTGVLE